MISLRKVCVRFYILLLLSLSFPISAYAGNFLNLEVSKLNNIQKKVLIAQFQEFLLEYEKKNQHFYASAPMNYSPLNLWLSSAFAGAGDDCLFGGWKSITDANGLCFRPQKKNKDYANYQDKCSETELYCNPVLFGHEICVDFSTSSARRSAYQSCNRVFKTKVEKGETSLDIVAAESDPDEFLSLMKGVENVCLYGRQSTTGMCASLRHKVSDYISAEAASTTVQNLIKSKKSENPDFIAGALADAETRIKELTKYLNENCFENKYTELTEAQDLACQNAAGELKSLSTHAQELIYVLESNKLELYSDLVCSQDPFNANVNVESFAWDMVNAASEVSCTQAEIKEKKKNCTRDIECVALSTFTSMMPIMGLFRNMSDKNNDCSNSSNNCIQTLVTGIAKNIADLFEGIWGLLKMGAGAVKDGVVSLWNWINNAEGKSTEKQLAAAGMSEGDVNKMEEDPDGFFSSLWKGIKHEVNHFMTHSVGCQKWSGTPNFSDCLKPFKGFDCMSCGTYITGFCNAAGYILPELLTTIFTGGLGNFVKSAGKGVSIVGKTLKASGKLKKIAQAAKNSRVMKTVIATGKGVGKVVTKSGRVVSKVTSKIFNSAVKSIKALRKLPGFKQADKLAQKILEKGHDKAKVALAAARKRAAKVAEKSKKVADKAKAVTKKMADTKLAQKSKDVAVYGVDKSKQAATFIAKKGKQAASYTGKKVKQGSDYLAKSKLGDNKLTRAYKRMQKSGNEALTNAGKRLEGRAQNYAMKNTDNALTFIDKPLGKLATKGARYLDELDEGASIRIKNGDEYIDGRVVKTYDDGTFDVVTDIGGMEVTVPRVGKDQVTLPKRFLDDLEEGSTVRLKNGDNEYIDGQIAKIYDDGTYDVVTDMAGMKVKVPKVGKDRLEVPDQFANPPPVRKPARVGIKKRLENSTSKAKESVSNGLKNVTNKVKENIGNSLTSTRKSINSGINKIKSGAKTTYQSVRGKIKNGFRRLKINRQAKQAIKEKREVFEKLDKIEDEMKNLKMKRNALKGKVEKNVSKEGGVKLSKDEKNFIGLDNEMLKLNNEAMDIIQESLAKKGIPTIRVDNRVVLDLSKPNPNMSVDFYKRIKERFGANEITLSMYDNVDIGSLGFKRGNRVELGMGQFKKFMDDTLETTGKHEGRHMMFEKMRSNGRESVYHQTFESSSKNLNEGYAYKKYMSAEEIYTQSNDIGEFTRNMRRSLNGNKMVKPHDYLDNMIWKSEVVRDISKGTKEMTQSFVDNIDKTINKLQSGDYSNVYELLRDNKIDIPSFGNKITLSDSKGRMSYVNYVSDREKDLISKVWAKKAWEADPAATIQLLKDLKARQLKLNKVATKQYESASFFYDDVVKLKSRSRIPKSKLKQVMDNARDISNASKENFRGFAGN